MSLPALYDPQPAGGMTMVYRKTLPSYFSWYNPQPTGGITLVHTTTRPSVHSRYDPSSLRGWNAVLDMPLAFQ